MERRRGTGNRVKTNKERRADWESIDGLNLSEVPVKLVSELMKVIKTPRGEYGEDHEDALSQAHSMIRNTDLSKADKAGLIVSVTKDIVGRANRTEKADEAYYNVRHEVLPQVLGVTFFVKSGKELGAALETDGHVERADIIGSEDRQADTDRFPTLTSVSKAVASQVLKRFNEYELTQFGIDVEDLDPEPGIDLTAGMSEEELDERTFVSIGNKKKAAHFLETGLVESARMMSKFYVTSKKKFDSVDDIVDRLDQHDALSRIDTVKIDTNADNLRVLPINELRLGHQDGKEGIKLVQQTVEMLKQMPEEKRPQVITVTNLIQSDFEHSQAQKRQALGIKEISEQFDAANKILDLLRETGIPIIVSLGQDDHRMAKDAALNIVNEMNGIVNQGGKENFIAYYGVNKMMQDTQHQVHKLFYLQNILPLSYRMGRPLRTKDVVSKDTGGDLNYNEYFALYDYVTHGAELPEGLGIDPEVIVKMGEWKDGLCFVDDFNLVATTENETRDVAYRHVTQFTSESLKQNHMQATMKLLGSLAAKNGTGEMADLIMSGQQQEHYSLANRAVSLPGLWDTEKSLNRKQYYASAPGDTSRRANLIRSVPGVPTLSMIEMTDDGRFIQSFISKEFMDKADSLPRTAIFELCDLQIGSPSARPDLQIMYLSYMLETAKKMPIAISITGDIIQGHIFPQQPDEAQATGLISLKTQKIHVRQILSSVFDTSDPIIRGLVENVIDVTVQPGNHDKIMRPRFPNNLDDNIDYLISDFEKILPTNPGEQSRVRHEAVFHQEGTPVGTWMARTHLGAYSMISAHYHLERGMKGNGGPPVADAYRRVQGLGQKAPDILLGAHWHNPQTAVFGNTLSVIGGPMAGQTEFEDFRGMKAVPYGTVIMIGGGEPVSVESISAQTLRSQGAVKLEKGNKIITGAKYGQMTPDKLEDQGLYDDAGFDPKIHGPYMHEDYPKSAMMKKILKLQRAASHLAMFEGENENPNRYDENGKPIQLNDLTRRAYEIAARKA